MGESRNERTQRSEKRSKGNASGQTLNKKKLPRLAQAIERRRKTILARERNAAQECHTVTGDVLAEYQRLQKPKAPKKAPVVNKRRKKGASKRARAVSCDGFGDFSAPQLAQALDRKRKITLALERKAARECHTVTGDVLAEYQRLRKLKAPKKDKRKKKRPSTRRVVSCDTYSTVPAKRGIAKLHWEAIAKRVVTRV